MDVEILIKILKEEGELTKKNLFQMTLGLQFKNNELLNEDGDLFLTVDSLITLNNYVTDSHNILLRQINVKPAFHNKQYMDFTMIETELYTLVDRFNNRQITPRVFVIYFLIKYIHFQMVMAEHVKFYLKTDTKFYQILKMIFSYGKQLIFQNVIIILFLILLDQIFHSDCIVNNGNILTNGRWRCYHEMGQKICYKYA